MLSKGKPVTLVHGNELLHLQIKLLGKLSNDFRRKTFSRLWMSWIRVNGPMPRIEASLPVCSSSSGY
jgi:hypothetical protein